MGIACRSGENLGREIKHHILCIQQECDTFLGASGFARRRVMASA